MYGVELDAPDPDFVVFLFFSSLAKLSRRVFHLFCRVVPEKKQLL